jgi:hypothetical protein
MLLERLFGGVLGAALASLFPGVFCWIPSTVFLIAVAHLITKARIGERPQRIDWVRPLIVSWFFIFMIWVVYFLSGITQM